MSPTKGIFFVSLFIIGASVPVYSDFSSEDASSYETIPEMRVDQVIDSAMITSPLHSVENSVRSDGYLNAYVLKTKFGVFHVRGTYFLYKRIKELEALEFIEKNYSTQTVVYESSKSAAKDMVVAPINATKKVITTITDQEKLSRTASKIPGGISNLFTFVSDSATQVTGSVLDAANNMISGNDAGEESREKSVSGTVSDAADFISETTLEYVGYNKSYRMLCKQMSIDPYTGNQILRDELRRISALKSGISVGSKFVPGISIPGIGIANRYLGYAETAAAYEDPKKIEALNKKKLEYLDTIIPQNEKRREGITKALLDNTHYSPVMRNVLLGALEQLAKAKVKNIDTLITISSKSSSREASYFFVSTISLLSKINSKNRVVSVMHNEPIPLGVTADGTLVMPLAVDTIFWTSKNARFMKNLIVKAKDSYKVKKLEILVAGKASRRFESEIKKIIPTQVRNAAVF